MNKSLKRVIVSAMALSLLVPAVSAPKAEAAAKPTQSATKTPATTAPANTATAVPTATPVATFRPLVTPNMTEVQYIQRVYGYSS